MRVISLSMKPENVKARERWRNDKAYRERKIRFTQLRHKRFRERVHALKTVTPETLLALVGYVTH